jgi:hypothetical protein
VNRYLAAYAESEYLGVKYDAEQCMDNLLKNLLCESTSQLVQIVRSKYEYSQDQFNDTCDYLLKYYFEQQWAHNQDLITTPTTRPRRTQAILSEETAVEGTMDDDRVAAIGQATDAFMVSEAWWKASTPEDRDLLRRLRNRARAKFQSLNEHSGSGQKEQSKNHREETVPNTQAQLATSNQTMAFVEIEDDSEDDSAVLHMNEIHNQCRDMFGGMARMESNEEVRCHLEYCDRLAYLTRTPRAAFATADSGADTTVLGKEWLINLKDPVRKVNLVGFDA